MKRVCGIYCIENKINNKKYIGQSINIFKRWNNHKSTSVNKNDKCYDYPLYKAFRKYGIENFNFYILEECEEKELDKKELEYIERNKSLSSGYNQVFPEQGGTRLTPEYVKEIIRLLSENTLSTSEIADKYKITNHSIRDINAGRTWYKKDIRYPIRKLRPRTLFYCNNCGKELSGKTKYELCRECYINSEARHVKDRPSKEILYDLLLNKSFKQVGREYNITDNAVRRWCRGYNIPDKASYYKGIKKKE